MNNSGDELAGDDSFHPERIFQFQIGQNWLSKYFKKMKKNMQKAIRKFIIICNKHEISKRVGFIFTTIFIILGMYFLFRPYHIIEFCAKVFIMAFIIKLVSNSMCGS